MKQKLIEVIWTKRLNKKEWMQNAIIEILGDVIMIVMAFVMGYYLKTMFIQ